ncbi:hypothetical protein KDL01_14435 [Actinospica durhamensis]|uniref:PE-PGRS family protein n=1 Tax=Actinospica durhamensis TaxID=1508375 RepID=A0A941EV37_9ACTN|nr:hypothetical protein [Actinospica durhamensis]MBR7834469.1 hypothetical protein [Actinospica durhamensis]
MAAEPVLPTLRAAVFAGVCLGLGAGAHSLMAHAGIPAWALVLGGVGAFVPARVAAGRSERGLAAIAGCMAGLQVLLHLLFDYAQHAAQAASSVRVSDAVSSGAVSSAASTVSSATVAPGMRMSAAQMAEMADGSAAGSMHMGALDLGSLHLGALHLAGGMLLGHALAALVCSWWLRRGEAAVHALVRSAVFRLRVVRIVVAWILPPADRTPGRVQVSPYISVLGSQWLRGVLARRGPPLSVAR